MNKSFRERRLERDLQQMAKAQERANAEIHMLRHLLDLRDTKVLYPEQVINNVLAYLPHNCAQIIVRLISTNDGRSAARYYHNSGGAFPASQWLDGLIHTLRR